MTSAALKKTIIANPLVPDQEAAAFLAADEHWSGLAYYWRKLLPSNVYKVLEALLEHVRFSPKTWQSGNPPIPSHERLATLSGISVRTVCRILARDASGHYSYTYRRCVYHRVSEASIACYETERARQVEEHPDAKPWPSCAWCVGDLVAVKRDLAAQLHLDACYELGDLIGLFIVSVDQRRRFDEHQRRWLRTTNAYHVRPIMPLPPTLGAEITYGLQLALVRQQRADLTAEAPLIQAASAAPSSMNMPSWPSHCSAKLAEEYPSVIRTEYSEEITSISSIRTSLGTLADASDAKECLGPLAIGKTEIPAHTTHRDGTEDGDERGNDDHAIEQNRVHSVSSPLAPRRSVNHVSHVVALLPEAAQRIAADIAAQKKRRAWLDHRAQIDAVIGPDIQGAAANMDDGAPLTTRNVLVSAFTTTNTPLDELPAALRLIEHRYRRVYGAGGKPIKTKAIATWISVARSVIAKGKGWGYDFDRQDAKEQREAQLRRDARAAAVSSAHGTTDLSYIQSPAYYQRLDGRRQGETNTPIPPTSAPARPCNPPAPRRSTVAKGWDDEYYERTGLNRYRR